LDTELVKVAAARARVVEFFYGDPDPALVDVVHAAGALACWQVGSTEEAVAAEQSGCDLIAAQGIEAGGHVRGRLGLFPLLAQVLDAVKVPVIAAGGIGTARSMAAALAGGATYPIPRFAPPTPNRDTVGEIGAMALYAGHSVDAVRRIQPAAEIVRELSDGAERLLRANSAFTK